MEEIWKFIDGYEGYYEISNLGRVRSVERVITCGGYEAGNRHVPIYTRTIKSRFLKFGWVAKKGSKTKYVQVILSRDNLNEHFLVAVLVAKAFIPNPENLPQVNHKDFDKSHNGASNLEWVTALGNTRHAIVNNHRSCLVKLTPEKARVIKQELKNRVPQRVLAQRFHVSRWTISDISLGKNWACV